MRTGTIRFNVLSNGREHTGADRNFDTRGLATLINSPAVQETVKLRGMLGYYGHWVREVFGLDVPETGIINGEIFHLEPALVTTRISADQDGTIEHEAEFLDTEPGEKAKKLHMLKVGGFSTAIDAKKTPTGLLRAVGFYGLDYVYDPNVSGNRGYVLDSAKRRPLTREAVLDAAIREERADSLAMMTLCTEWQQAHTLALAALQRSQAENEELLGLLASRKSEGMVLDSVGRGFVRPARVAHSGLAEEARDFLGARLEPFAQPSAQNEGERERRQTLVERVSSGLWGRA